MNIKPEGRGLAGNFASTLGSSNDTMKELRDKSLTYPVKQQNKTTKIELTFYYSVNQEVPNDFKNLKHNDYASSNAQVVEVSSTQQCSPRLELMHHFDRASNRLNRAQIFQITTPTLYASPFTLIPQLLILLS